MVVFKRTLGRVYFVVVVECVLFPCRLHRWPGRGGQLCSECPVHIVMERAHVVDKQRRLSLMNYHHPLLSVLMPPRYDAYSSRDRMWVLLTRERGQILHFQLMKTIR